MGCLKSYKRDRIETVKKYIELDHVGKILFEELGAY